MFSLLRNIFGGGLLGEITRELAGLYRKRLDARSAEEQRKHDRRIMELESHRKVLLADTRQGIATFVRAFLIAPFGLYLWKVVVWDKLLKWGITDPLSPWLQALAGGMIGFYFINLHLRGRR
jgi:hypothetical protein